MPGTPPAQLNKSDGDEPSIFIARQFAKDGKGEVNRTKHGKFVHKNIRGPWKLISVDKMIEHDILAY